MPQNKAMPLIAAGVVGVVAIVGIKVATGGHDDSTSATAPGPAPAGTGKPRNGCTHVTVAASSEKAALLSQLADTYNDADHRVDGTCVDVRVNSVASGTAESQLAGDWDTKAYGARPTVWTPAASTWVGLLRNDLTVADKPAIVPDKSESVVSTPLVLAMPKPMAQALGWPDKHIGWSDITKLATAPGGWGSVGHPEWGTFKLGKTNPNISTSGLAATVGAFIAATGRSSDLSDADLDNPKVKQVVAGSEHAVVHYGDTTLTYLSALQRADDAGSGLGYVSAVAVEEKSVVDYNRGNPTGDPKTLGKHKAPKVPLVGVFPTEGTLYSDSPFVILNGSWVTDAQKSAAADFEQYLQSDAAQKTFTDAGFRTFDGKAGAAVKADPNLDATGPELVLTPPSPTVLAKVRTTWTDVRKKAKVLLLLDVSGSMGEEVPNADGGTKLDLAKDAVLNAMTEFSDRDEVGVWAFTTGFGGGNSTYARLADVAPLSSNRAKIVSAIKNLTPLQGTPLYAATKAAVADMKAHFDADAVNAVVLLTDGRNEYNGDNDLDGLLDKLSEGASEGEGLRVFSVAYGEGADLSTLRKISQASNAAAYDATDPANITKVFTDVISNF